MQQIYNVMDHQALTPNASLEWFKEHKSRSNALVNVLSMEHADDVLAHATQAFKDQEYDYNKK